tara:strand:+ start:76 stop:327 length:252 start_codon:yes stop_codon:yes gene_type:complete
MTKAGNRVLGAIVYKALVKGFAQYIAKQQNTDETAIEPGSSTVEEESTPKPVSKTETPEVPKEPNLPLDSEPTAKPSNLPSNP